MLRIENRRNPAPQAGCGGVADREADTGGNGVQESFEEAPDYADRLREKYAETTEQDAVGAALGHDCPVCGAKATVRCRILSPNKTNPARTKVDVRSKPCPGRVQVAWRALREAE